MIVLAQHLSNHISLNNEIVKRTRDEEDIAIILSYFYFSNKSFYISYFALTTYLLLVFY